MDNEDTHLTTGCILHDIIVDELFTNKSLAALIFLIDRGRELELFYNECKYFVSKDQSMKYVSIWNGENEQSFNSMEELINKAIVSKSIFLSAWPTMKLDTLF